VTHPVLSNKSADKINSSDLLDWMIVSDTVFHEKLPAKFRIVSSARMFARAIDTVISHKSLNSVN
jgi:phosphoribosylpyrophosphate synthetase